MFAKICRRSIPTNLSSNYSFFKKNYNQASIEKAFDYGNANSQAEYELDLLKTKYPEIKEALFLVDQAFTNEGRDYYWDNLRQLSYARSLEKKISLQDTHYVFNHTQIGLSLLVSNLLTRTLWCFDYEELPPDQTILRRI